MANSRLPHDEIIRRLQEEYGRPSTFTPFEGALRTQVERMGLRDEQASNVGDAFNYATIEARVMAQRLEMLEQEAERPMPTQALRPLQEEINRVAAQIAEDQAVFGEGRAIVREEAGGLFGIQPTDYRARYEEMRREQEATERRRLEAEAMFRASQHLRDHTRLPADALRWVDASAAMSGRFSSSFQQPQSQPRGPSMNNYFDHSIHATPRGEFVGSARYLLHEARATDTLMDEMNERAIDDLAGKIFEHLCQTPQLQEFLVSERYRDVQFNQRLDMSMPPIRNEIRTAHGYETHIDYRLPATLAEMYIMFAWAGVYRNAHYWSRSGFPGVHMGLHSRLKSMLYHRVGQTPPRHMSVFDRFLPPVELTEASKIFNQEMCDSLRTMAKRFKKSA